MKEKFARLLSVLLGPQVWLPILLISFIYKTGLSPHQQSILLPLILILQVVVPPLYLYLAPKLGLAEAWDLPNKSERYPFFIIVSIVNLISLITIYFIGNNLLFSLSLMLFTLLLITMIVTYFWKISLHASLNTFGSIMVNYLFDWKLPLLYLTIPLILWARLVLKRHTLVQLIVPVIIDMLFIFAAFYFLDYLK